jgi:transporter family protein
MQDWMLFTLIATAIYGFWGYFPKLGTNYLDPKSALVYEFIGIFGVTVAVLASMQFKLPVHPKGITFAILTGISGMIGTLFLLMALSKGKASVIVPMTALYPVGTLILVALTLKEPITARQLVGIGLSFVSIFLISVG